ncbi:Hypothetical_protein [Hexamita inflata]|uniref:Hypothetical_protein n=1 Tax=Hexamita inflata TaxID=28002 RepID=A0AA86RAL9_9EUKA|nr:Hypothetical protein HINF_LOCUS56960 [Hexamita inflata]CAI9969318.1 Hypothetical protein HINF_LOCUS56963 [Hexamita inflata]
MLKCSQTEQLGLTSNARTKEAEIQALFSVMDSYSRAFVRRRKQLHEIQLCQITCRQQNPRIKVLSYHQGSVLRAGRKQAFMIGKRQQSINFLETHMARPRWIPVQIGLHEALVLRPWMLIPKLLVALIAEVRLTYISASKTNDHSRGLTVSCTED